MHQPLLSFVPFSDCIIDPLHFILRITDHLLQRLITLVSALLKGNIIVSLLIDFFPLLLNFYFIPIFYFALKAEETDSATKIAADTSAKSSSSSSSKKQKANPKNDEDDYFDEELVESQAGQSALDGLAEYIRAVVPTFDKFFKSKDGRCFDYRTMVSVTLRVYCWCCLSRE
jgi:hypothetical protein